MPRGGPEIIYGAGRGLNHASQGSFDISLADAQGASWERNWNGAWYDALNRRDSGEVTHFAIMHADIAPAVGWLDVYLAEMTRLNMAYVTAVVPFRDFSGITSVGIDNMEDNYCPRRLVMKEIMRLPETFVYEDCLRTIPNVSAGSRLICNTGLLLIDLDKHKWGNWHDKVNWTFVHKRDITTEPLAQSDGSTLPVGYRFYSMLSEDWEFSRRLHEMHVPYCATRKVPLHHVGQWQWSNQEPFGQDTDTLWMQKLQYEKERAALKSAYERGRKDERESLAVLNAEPVHKPPPLTAHGIEWSSAR